jgi:hypothetical protein
MNNENISKALTDVWEWKESAYKDVANLPIKDAVRKRIQDAETLSKKLGFKEKDVSYEKKSPNQSPKTPVFGSCKGLFIIPDEPLEDFKDYM